MCAVRCEDPDAARSRREDVPSEVDRHTVGNPCSHLVADVIEDARLRQASLADVIFVPDHLVLVGVRHIERQVIGREHDTVWTGLIRIEQLEVTGRTQPVDAVEVELS